MNSNEFKLKLLPINQKLYRYSFRFISNREEAEDIVQEVYLRLWNIRYKLGDIINLEAFATTITKNLCLDKLKSRYLSLTDDLNKQVINAESFEIDPHKRIENIDNIAIVKNIINQLPYQQQFIFKLKDLDELSFEEIEEITGLNINNIRVNLSRARKHIRNELIKIHEYGTGIYKKST